MEENSFTELEIKKARRANYIVLAVFGIIFLAILAWLCSYKYRHTFSRERWLELPEKRAKMTADLFSDYELVGMTELEVLDLLGKPNNDYGYFNEEERYVYYLGSERTIIDSEWLLLDFENGTVVEYKITTD